MRRIIHAALLLCITIAMTAHAADEPPKKVVKINDSIYMAPTTGNVYMVTTPAGNVVIDTAIGRIRPQKPESSCLRKTMGR